jgi:hypothetical protein
LGSEHIRKSDDGKEIPINWKRTGFKNQYGLTGRPNSWKLKHKKGRLWKIKKRKKIS